MNSMHLKSFFNLIIEDINRIEFLPTKTNKVYTPLFSSSIDHCISLNILKDQNITTSMYALVRPAVENYLRAMWIKYSDEADPLSDDATEMHFPKKFDHLMSSVFREKPELEGEYSLKSIINYTLKNIHDFTHGGIQSIARQHNETGDILTYEREQKEITSIIKFSVLISFLSYSEIIQENSHHQPLKTEHIEHLFKKLI